MSPTDRSSRAVAAELRVMSGAAVEPGLLAAAAAFREATGADIKIAFASAPEIRRRFGAGETPDVAIAPPAVRDDLRRGRLGRGCANTNNAA